MSVQQSSPTVTKPRSHAWRAGLIAVAIVLVALVVGGWSASQQGYVSWLGTACTDEGYNPMPSYDALVSEFNKSPYCARLIRDETWF